MAHLVFPRVSAERPVLEFSWEAVQAFVRAPDFEVEVLVPVPTVGLGRLQNRWRRLRGAHPFDDQLRPALQALLPRPTLVPFVPVPGHSVEAAALSLAAHLVARPRVRRPDVLQGSLLDEGGYAASQIAKTLGIASVAVAHGSDVRAARGELEKGRERRAQEALRDASLVISMSSTMQRQLEHLGAASEIFPFTSSAQRFRPRPRPADGEIMFVGRVGRPKGVDLLLDALVELPYRLRLVGPVLPDFDVQTEIRQRGLQDRVVVHGEATDELPDLYAGCRMTVLASRAEGLPCVVVESLLCGRPVVASNVGAVHEVVDEDVGQLVPSEDRRALARALDAVYRADFDEAALRARAEPLAWETVGPALAARVRRLSSR